MLIGKTVTLNVTEQEVCKLVAAARFKDNRAASVVNSKRGRQSNEFTDLEGFAAELAFCKLFNTFPSFTSGTCSSQKGEDLGDTSLPNGLTIDVKVTKYLNGRLIAVPWKKATCDIFALMVGVFPTYTYKGMMWSKELLKKERLDDLGYGPTYMAEQAELKEKVYE